MKRFWVILTVAVLLFGCSERTRATAESVCSESVAILLFERDAEGDRLSEILKPDPEITSELVVGDYRKLLKSDDGEVGDMTIVLIGHILETDVVVLRSFYQELTLMGEDIPFLDEVTLPELRKVLQKMSNQSPQPIRASSAGPLG